MAGNYKLERLRRIVEANQSEDDLLLMYLHAAEQAILNRLYPMSDVSTSLPSKYESRQMEIAMYLYNRQGSEGEIAHKENGIDRTYESASIPPSMLSDIIPFGTVI